MRSSEEDWLIAVLVLCLKRFFLLVCDLQFTARVQSRTLRTFRTLIFDLLSFISSAHPRYWTWWRFTLDSVQDRSSYTTTQRRPWDTRCVDISGYYMVCSVDISWYYNSYKVFTVDISRYFKVCSVDISI